MRNELGPKKSLDGRQEEERRVDGSPDWRYGSKLTTNVASYWTRGTTSLHGSPLVSKYFPSVRPSAPEKYIGKFRKIIHIDLSRRYACSVSRDNLAVARFPRGTLPTNLAI